MTGSPQGSTRADRYDAHDHWLTRAVESARRRVGSPFLGSVLVFGVAPVLILVAYVGLRWEYVTTGYLWSLVLVAVVLLVSPYLVWYYDAVLLPTFLAKFSDVVVEPDRLAGIGSRYQRFLADRWAYAAAPFLLPIPVLLVGGRSFVRARGLFGVTDPLFWLVAAVLLWLSVLVGLGFFVVLVTVLVVRAVSAEPLRIDPLHPDGLGGMSSVGYYAIRTTLLFSVGALLVPLHIQFAAFVGPGMTVFVYSMDLLYAGFIALSFLYPTVTVYRRADAARTDILDDLRRQYTELKRREGEPAVGAAVEPDDPAVDRKLERIRREYRDYEAVSLYPMELSILVRLVGSVLLPLVFVLVDVYLRPETIDTFLSSVL